MYGKNIQAPSDPLQKISEEQFYSMLTHPKPEIESRIRSLRTGYTIDARRYSELKRKLPYVVCGSFNPPSRCIAHFACTDTFILDFDHLSEKQLSLDDLRQRFKADSRVMICFASPSLDGLKLLFHLKDRCFDAGLYSLFYKNFAQSFARQYDIEQVLDARTSDVSRACFISVDPQAYFNPDADPVDLHALVSDDASAFFDNGPDAGKSDQKKKAPAPKKAEPAAEPPAKPEPPKDKPPVDPSKDVMARIRETLRKVPPRPVRQVYVPEQLNDIIGPLCEVIKKAGLEVTEVRNIQYGKKIRTRVGTYEGELNLFYGKRGYTPVESPRRGTDAELNQLMVAIVEAFLASPDSLPF